MSRFRKKSGFMNVFGRSDADKSLLHGSKRFEAPSDADLFEKDAQSSDMAEDGIRMGSIRSSDSSLPTDDSPTRSPKPKKADSEEGGSTFSPIDRRSLMIREKSLSERALKVNETEKDVFSPQTNKGRASGSGMQKAPLSAKPTTGKRNFLKKGFSERFGISNKSSSLKPESRIGEIKVNLAAATEISKAKQQQEEQQQQTAATQQSTPAPSAPATKPQNHASSTGRSLSPAPGREGPKIKNPIGSLLSKPKKKEHSSFTSPVKTPSEATIQVVKSNESQRSFHQFNLGDLVPVVICKAARTMDIVRELNKKGILKVVEDTSSEDESSVEVEDLESPEHEPETSTDDFAPPRSKSVGHGPVPDLDCLKNQVAGDALKSFGDSTFAIAEETSDFRREKSDGIPEDGPKQRSHRRTVSLGSGLREVDLKKSKKSSDTQKPSVERSPRRRKDSKIYHTSSRDAKDHSESQNGSEMDSADEKDKVRSNRKSRKSSKSSKKKKSKDSGRDSEKALEGEEKALEEEEKSSNKLGEDSSQEVLTWVRSAQNSAENLDASAEGITAPVISGQDVLAFSPPPSPRMADEVHPFKSPVEKKKTRRRTNSVSKSDEKYDKNLKRTPVSAKHSRRRISGKTKDSKESSSRKDSLHEVSLDALKPSLVVEDPMEVTSNSRIDEMKAVMEDFEKMDFSDATGGETDAMSLGLKEIPFASVFSHLKKRAGGDLDDNDDMSILAEKLGIGNGDTDDSKGDGLAGRYRRLEIELEQSQNRLFESTQEVARMEREVEWLQHRLDDMKR